LLIESSAPGCNRLQRQVRLTAGSDYVEIINLVDKSRLQAQSYHAKEGKESVNFAFPFQVPGGEMQLELPLAMIKPDADQMPSACKNWLTIGRWADVSNGQQGITWITLDAPLIQIGGLTANLLNSQTNPDVWRKHIEPSQKIFSWAMNNHWGTNYRAYQDGPTVFRYVLHPHRALDPGQESRLAIGFSQPLLAARAEKVQPAKSSLFEVTPSAVIVSALKPADDGRALIVRLFNTSSSPKYAQLNWGSLQPTATYLSDTSEQRRARVEDDDVTLPAHALVTLRAELP
jgi:hypothetical protein